MATKSNPKLQQLIDRVSEIEAQKKDIEKQLSDAIGERYRYERELNRSLKPTEAMLYVARSMARGATLTSYEYTHPYRRALAFPDSNQVEYVKESVLVGLCVREIITVDDAQRGVCTRGYKLTDHGRQVAARA